MKALEKELGYPHELLVLSSKKAKDVLQGQHRNRTKILALLFLSTQGHKTDLKITIKDELYLEALESLARKNKLKIRKIANELNKKIEEYISQFEKTQSTSAFSELEKFLADCFYLHLVSQEIVGISILSERIIKRSASYLKPESELKVFLDSLQLLSRKEVASTEMSKIANTFLSANKSPLIEASLLLSLLLAVRYPASKSELLLAHYTILKTVANDLGKLLEHEKLDDTALQQLFTTSIVLFLCGYAKSLRLSHEEKINYIKKVMGISFVEHEIEKNFDQASKVGIFGLPLPLSGIIIAAIILVFLHVFVEIYSPGSISIGIVSFNLPPVPIFLTISVALMVVTFIKIVRFKRDLLRGIRRGGENE
jgi:hypothetical protein